MRSAKLRYHGIILAGTGACGPRLKLRPMSENDWQTLLKWNNDPEVLFYCEGDDVRSRSMEDIRGIYRAVSRTAFCFMIELDARPIGECWLQK